MLYMDVRYSKILNYLSLMIFYIFCFYIINFVSILPSGQFSWTSKAEVQNLLRTPPCGGGGFFEKLSYWGKFFKIVTLEEVLKIVIVGKFWEKSIRRGILFSSWLITGYNSFFWVSCFTCIFYSSSR